MYINVKKTKQHFKHMNIWIQNVQYDNSLGWEL